MRILPTSLYLHIPFCVHRCGYCDFNTYAGLEDLIPAYAHALRVEIALAGEAARAAYDAKLPVHTIFFGGGTPSLLPAGEVEAILAQIDACFDLQPQIEISMEANPGTLARDYLRALRHIGINRLSLGVQSAHPGELRLLERQHDYPAVTRSVSWARQAGFDNLNLDLIFGLPEQPLENWQRTLELALGLAPEHFSLYALSLEHGTPFGRYAARGLLSSPDSDVAADMYEYATERLANNGYAQYEISNWAHVAAPATASATTPATSPPAPDWRNPALACRHNLQYWRNLPYLGLGAGAHGYAAGTRTANVLSPAAYIARLVSPRPSQPVDALNAMQFPHTPATQSALPIDYDAEVGETMMMGLRLVREGVSEAGFSERFGRSLRVTFAPHIERLARQGLLEWAGPQADLLRLTQRGRLLGNRVFVEFI
jgi:oxygen-independent coproporphyrinogen-3 oxidase